MISSFIHDLPVMDASRAYYVIVIIIDVYLLSH